MPPFDCSPCSEKKDAPRWAVKGNEFQKVNEFYKKGCQEKSSASTGGARLFLEIQPTLFRYPEEVRLVVHSRKVSLLLVASSSVQDAASRTMLTMVLSEARGLSLFLVIRGGIACNG